MESWMGFSVCLRFHESSIAWVQTQQRTSSWRASSTMNRCDSLLNYCLFLRKDSKRNLLYFHLHFLKMVTLCVKGTQRIPMCCYTDTTQWSRSLRAAVDWPLPLTLTQTDQSWGGCSSADRCDAAAAVQCQTHVCKRRMHPRAGTLRQVRHTHLYLSNLNVICFAF